MANFTNNTVSSSNALALDANVYRNGWFCQNVGTGVLYVNFSDQAPTTGQFNIALAGGSAIGDGNGGKHFDENGLYKGPIFVSGATPRYIIWDL